MNPKLRLLDLYCKAGGATKGYQQAGFYVVGVDNESQPNYCGDEFVQADALDVLADKAFLATFDAAAGSPPCRDHTRLAHLAGQAGTGWLLAATRKGLEASGLPWVMENVAGAPMAAHIILCGTMFGLAHDGFELRRHRLFETSGFFCLTPPCQHRLPCMGVYGHGSARGKRGRSASAPEARALMDIGWMTLREMAQAIPPAYTEFVGAALMAHLRSKEVAA